MDYLQSALQTRPRPEMASLRLPDEEDIMRRAMAEGRSAAYSEAGYQRPKVAPGDDEFVVPQAIKGPKQQTDIFKDPAFVAMDAQRKELHQTEQLYHQRVRDFDATEGVPLVWPKAGVSNTVKQIYGDPYNQRLQTLANQDPESNVVDPSVRKMAKERQLLMEKRQRLVDEADRITRARMDFDANTYLPLRARMQSSLLQPPPPSASSAPPEPTDYLAPEGQDWVSERIRKINLERFAAGDAPIKAGTISGSDTAVPWGPLAPKAEAPQPATAPAQISSRPSDEIDSAPPEEYTPPASTPPPPTEQLAKISSDKGLSSQWSSASPWERLGMMFGSRGYGQNQPEFADPVIGSEAAGTKGRLATIPKMTGTGALSGVVNAANEFTSGLTTPENVALLAATGGAAGLARAGAGTAVGTAARAAELGAAGYFTGEMAHGTYQGVKRVADVMHDPKATPADVAEAITSTGLTGLMTTASGLGAAHIANEFRSRGSAPPTDVPPAGPKNGEPLIPSEPTPAPDATPQTGDYPGTNLPNERFPSPSQLAGRSQSPEEPVVDASLRAELGMTDATPQTGKPLPPSARVTIQEPAIPGRAESGYQQIDLIRPDGESDGSFSPADLRAQGYDVPDLSGLKTGQYNHDLTPFTAEAPRGETPNENQPVPETQQPANPGSDDSGRSPDEPAHPAANEPDDPTEGASRQSDDSVRRPSVQGDGYGGTEGQRQRLTPEGGFTFVSPNTGEMNFQQATEALGTDQHAALVERAKELAPDAEVKSAVGDWADGAENTIMVRSPDADLGKIDKVAAQLGLDANQKNVLRGVYDPNGNALVHEVEFPAGTDIDAARKAMDDAGLKFKTIVPGDDGKITGIVFDGDASLTDNVLKLADHELRPTIYSDRATGDFIGDPNWSSRDDAAVDYRRRLGQTEPAPADQGGAPQGGVRDSGAPAEPAQGVTDRILAALEGAKFAKPGQLAAHTPLTLAWDAAIDTAILGIKAGRKVADVVREAIDHFRSKFPGATDDHVRRLEDTITGLAAGRESEPAQMPSRIPVEQMAGGATPPTRGHVDTVRKADLPQLEPQGRDVIGFDEARANADRVVNERGLTRAVDDALNARGMTPGTATMVLMRAEKRLRENWEELAAKGEQSSSAGLEAEHQFNRFVALVTAAAERATEQGRSVAYHAEVNRWTRQGLMNAAINQLKDKRDAALTDKGVRAARDMVNAVNAENARGVRVVLKELEQRMGVTKVTKGVWERYKDAASKQWADQVARGLPGAGSATPPPMAEFAKILTREVQNQIEAAMPAEQRAASRKLTAAEAIGEAVRNRDKYKEAWDKARADLEAKYKGQPDILEALDQNLAGVLDRPYSQKTLDRAIREAHRAARTSVRDMIERHYTEADLLGRNLADKLVHDAGIDGAEAKSLADAVTKRVGEITAQTKQQELARRLARSADTGVARTVRRQQLAEKLIKLSNLGALSDQQYLQMVAKDLKLPSLLPDQAKRLQSIADRIQSLPDGRARNEAVIDALTELRKIEGIGKVDVATSILYAHLLSGLTTQAKNIISTAINTTLDTSLLAATNPRQFAYSFMGALGEGFGHGLQQAGRTLKTGYADRGILAKTELDSGRNLVHEGLQPLGTMEILSRGNPESVGGKLLKGYSFLGRYVTRAMQAADSVFFETAKSAFDYVSAAKLAELADQGASRQSISRKVRDLLAIKPEDFDAARRQAEGEGVKGADAPLRVAEIIRQQRAKRLGYDLSEQSGEFGRHATFNDRQPRGVLGIVAEKVSSTTRDLPAAKIVVPFTRIVANVTNASLNYTPWGFKRAAVGYTGKGKFFGGDTLPGWERRMTAAKAVLGTTGMVALANYALQGRDKDKVPWITGRGPKDVNQRNQLRSTGWSPYSIKIGDRWVPYLNSPASLPAAIVGNWMDALHYDNVDGKSAGEMAGRALWSVPETVTNQSFLQGIGQLMDAIRDKDPKAGAQLLQSTIGAAVPGGNLVQQIDRAFDPTVRDASGLKGALIGRIPGARETLPAREDVRARPIESSPWNPILGTGQTNDPLAQLLAQKQAWIPEPQRPKLGPPTARRPATDEEFRALKHDAGKEVDQRLNMLLPQLRSMSDEDAKRMVDAVAREANVGARVRLELRTRK